MLEFSPVENTSCNNSSSELSSFVSSTSSCNNEALELDSFTTSEGCGGQGPQGPQGFSAYQIAVFNGFIGTEEEWLASLIGPEGPEGPQGPIGPEGPTGPGVPVGGTTGQILAKINSTNYNTEWINNFSLPTLTSGSVLFSNGTTIAQDNSNFFWDDTNNRLGIGTNAPNSRLHLSGSITAASAIARGGNITPTLVAAANNDLLVGLDINPTFTNGVFTTVNNVATRIYGGINSVGSVLSLHKFTANAASTSIDGAYYLGLGQNEYALNSFRLIGFGYHLYPRTHYPAYIGFQETSTASSTFGDLIFGTRNVTSDTQPSERMRITSTGNVGIGTTTPTATLHVKGLGTTPATTTLLTQNLSSLTTFQILDDGSSSHVSSLWNTNDSVFSVKTYLGTQTALLVNAKGEVTLGGTGATIWALTVADAWGTQFKIGNNGNIYFPENIQGIRNTPSTWTIRPDTSNNAGLRLNSYGYFFGGNDTRTLVRIDDTFFNAGAGGTNVGNYLNIKDTNINTSIGTYTFNHILVNPTINTSGGTSVVRGFYYNPTVTGSVGLTHRAIETTAGNVIFGNTVDLSSVAIGGTTTTLGGYPVPLTININQSTIGYGINLVGNGAYIGTSTYSNTILAGVDAAAVYYHYNYGSKDVHFGSGGSGNTLFKSSGNIGIGSNIATAAATAKLTIIGSGATSATTNLLTQNSSLTTEFRVKDDGVVRIQTTANGYTTIGQNTTNGSTPVIYAEAYAVQPGIAKFSNSNSGSTAIFSMYNGIYSHTLEGYGSTSGAANTSVLGILRTFAQTSGTSVDNMLAIVPTLNLTGTRSGSTVRGIYYNPTVTSLTGTTHIALETVSGDVILGSTSGSVGIGTATPSEKLHVIGNIISSAKIEATTNIVAGGTVQSGAPAGYTSKTMKWGEVLPVGNPSLNTIGINYQQAVEINGVSYYVMLSDVLQ